MSDRAAARARIRSALDREDGPAPPVEKVEHRFEKAAEGRYILTAPDHLNTELDVTHVRRDRGHLRAELTVRTGLAGIRTLYGVLFTADVNLSTLNGRDEVARALADRTRTAPNLAEWKQTVDDLAICINVAEAQGDPAVLLTGTPPPATHLDTFRTKGFTLPQRLPAMVFGPGDALKTYTIDTLAVDLAGQGIHVGIVDGEMGIDDHADRVARLTGGQSPGTIAYIGCSRPVMYERDRIADAIRTHALRYLFFDSVGFLVHDKPEAAESALAYFRTIRSLGAIGSLSLAHRAKSEDGDKMPFGSAFWFTSVRALWYAQRGDGKPGSEYVDVAYLTRKFNVGRWPAAHGLRFDFTGNRTVVTSVDPASVASLAPSLSTYERIKTLLRSGPKDLEAIAAEIPDATEETLTRTLRRYSGDRAKVLAFVRCADGRYGLAEKRYGQ